MGSGLSLHFAWVFEKALACKSRRTSLSTALQAGYKWYLFLPGEARGGRRAEAEAKALEQALVAVLSFPESQYDPSCRQQQDNHSHPEVVVAPGGVVSVCW